MYILQKTMETNNTAKRKLPAGFCFKLKLIHIFNLFPVLFKETLFIKFSGSIFSVIETYWIGGFNCWEVAWHVYVTDLFKYQISNYLTGQFLYARYYIYVMEGVKVELREGCPSRLKARNITMSSARELIFKTFKLSCVHTLLS